MTLKFSTVLALVEEHDAEKFHQAECSGSRVIARTEKKKLRRKQYVPSVPVTADSKYEAQNSNDYI